MTIGTIMTSNTYRIEATTTTEPKVRITLAHSIPEERIPAYLARFRDHGYHDAKAIRNVATWHDIAGEPVWGDLDLEDMAWDELRGEYHPWADDPVKA